MPLPVCCANLAKNCAGLVQSRRCGSTCFFFSSFFSEICRAKFSKKFQSAVYWSLTTVCGAGVQLNLVARVRAIIARGKTSSGVRMFWGLRSKVLEKFASLPVPPGTVSILFFLRSRKIIKPQISRISQIQPDWGFETGRLRCHRGRL